MSALKLETREQFEAWLEKKQCENWRTEDQLMVPVDDVRTLYDALRPRWLPVSERLPVIAKGRNYSPLVQFVTRRERIFGYLYSGPMGACWFDAEDVDEGDLKRFGLGEVSHWAEIHLPPLPEES